MANDDIFNDNEQPHELHVIVFEGVCVYEKTYEQCYKNSDFSSILCNITRAEKCDDVLICI